MTYPLPDVYLIFRLISIKAAGRPANLADRRYRGTRCLFANAHRALMNLDEEARRAGSKSARIASYFFFLLSFFPPPSPFPLSFHYFLRQRIAERRFNRRAWKPVARFLKRSLRTRSNAVLPSSLLFEYRLRELILLGVLLENLFFQLISRVYLGNFV